MMRRMIDHASCCVHPRFREHGLPMIAENGLIGQRLRPPAFPPAR
jgi:hypothetical protein